MDPIDYTPIDLASFQLPKDNKPKSMVIFFVIGTLTIVVLVLLVVILMNRPEI